MEKKLLTLDVGTTNSRIRLWNNEIMEDEIKLNIGVREEIEILRKKLSDEIEKFKENNRIEGIIASGMITSNLGLYSMPHITLPISIKDLADGIKVDEICGLPTYYITGIRTKEMLDEYHINDVIRGEEVEVYGMLKELDVNEECIIVLPGSHNKFIKVNEKKEILDFSTTISGELLEIITKYSILKSSLDSSFCEELSFEFLEKGYEQSKKKGFGAALFTVRTLELFNKTTKDERASYLLGMIIEQDINSLVLNKGLKENQLVIIGGGNQFTIAFSYLLEKKLKGINIKTINNSRLSSIGALEVIKASNLINI